MKTTSTSITLRANANARSSSTSPLNCPIRKTTQLLYGQLDLVSINLSFGTIFVINFKQEPNCAMRQVTIPLATLLVALMLPVKAYQSGSSVVSTSSITTSSIIRLRGNKLRRPELCRESLPRKSEDLPSLVITGRVKEVYLAGEPAQTSSGPLAAVVRDQQVANSIGATGGNKAENKALVTIIRVFKGNQQLVGSDIIISGFNSSNSTPCPNYVKPNDTWILLLNQLGERRYAIQDSNILSLNLNNLDRIDAISKNEPFRRRPPIEDILCEAHYCAYGRCVANERTKQVSCQCPDTCPPLPVPVCGSDNTTYTNECHLIKEGCRRQRPLFVTKETACWAN